MQPYFSKHRLPPQAIALSRELEEVGYELEYLQNLQAEVEERQVLIKREINAYSAPILHLPSEMTLEIFTTYLSGISWDHLASGQSLSVSQTPLLFGRICNAWRELAWSTPILWSSIQLDLMEYRVTPLDPALVEQWLVRSGTSPLSICVVSDQGRVPAFESSTWPILKLVARHAERWRNAALKLPLYLYDPIIFIKGRLPSLQCLRLSFEDKYDRRIQLGTFSVAPRLSDFCLTGSNLPHFVLTTNQLTKLTLRGIDAGACLDMLRRSPNVTHCAIQYVFHVGTVRNTLAPHLETLELSCSASSETISNIFDSLNIPAARNISCRGQLEGDFPHSHFISLISRSSCSLQQLSLANLVITHHHILECLQAVPSLRSLSLQALLIPSDMVFRMLTRHSLDAGIPPLVPNLEIFECRDDTCPLDFAILADFLSSRSRGWHRNDDTVDPLTIPRPTAKLQSVIIEHKECGVPNAHVSAALHILVEEGMEISLVAAPGTRL